MDQHRMVYRKLLAAVVALLAALVACGPAGGTPSGATQTPGAAGGPGNGADQPSDDWPTPTALTGDADGGDPLSGTAWVLDSYGPEDDPQQPVGPNPVTVSFEDGNLGASPGCNHYGAQYSLRGDKISISPGAMTEMACADERLMTQEQQLALALSAVTSYELAGDRLTLHYEGGALRLSAQQPAADRPLEGTVWTLDGIQRGDAVQSPVGGSSITLELSGGAASGSGGCNSYSAEYTLDGEGLHFGQVGATRMACDGGIDMQESLYFEMLQQVHSFSIDGELLTLITDSGALIFRAGAAG